MRRPGAQSARPVHFKIPLVRMPAEPAQQPDTMKRHEILVVAGLAAGLMWAILYVLFGAQAQDVEQDRQPQQAIHEVVCPHCGCVDTYPLVMLRGVITYCCMNCRQTFEEAGNGN